MRINRNNNMESVWKTERIMDEIGGDRARKRGWMGASAVNEKGNASQDNKNNHRCTIITITSRERCVCVWTKLQQHSFIRSFTWFPLYVSLSHLLSQLKHGPLFGLAVRLQNRKQYVYTTHRICVAVYVHIGVRVYIYVFITKFRRNSY